MNLSSSGFRADLRTPLLPIILLQVVLATLCFFAADTLVELVGRWVLLGISLLFRGELGIGQGARLVLLSQVMLSARRPDVFTL